MVTSFGKKGGEVNRLTYEILPFDEDGVLGEFQEMSGGFLESSCFH